MFSLVALTWHWAIPENIHDHTCTRMAFRNFEGKRGSNLNWKSKSIGGYLRLEFRRHGGGGLDLEFPQGTDDRVFLENAYFIDLISLQTKHKLTTLLMAAEDKHPLISDVFIWYSFVGKTNKKWVLHQAPEKHAAKHPFFSHENSLLN